MQAKARQQTAHEQEEKELRDALRRSDRLREEDVGAWYVSMRFVRIEITSGMRMSSIYKIYEGKGM